MLTFDIRDRRIPADIPCQIKPRRYSYISHRDIDEYKGSSKDCMIHVGFEVIPFSQDRGKLIPIQLRMYKKLANKLSAGYILIHLPRSLNEFRNIKKGLNLIDRMILSDRVQPYSGIVLLEIPCFQEDLNAYLTDNFRITDYKVIIHNYFKEILPHLGAFGGRIKIVFDTAHLYGNGCTTFELYMHTVNIVGEHLANIVHLNGNIKEPYMKDKHIPFIVCDDRNKLFTSFGEEGYKNLIRDVFERNAIVISENKFSKYPDITYDTFKEWCNNHNYRIIRSPSECMYTLR